MPPKHKGSCRRGPNVPCRPHPFRLTSETLPNVVSVYAEAGIRIYEVKEVRHEWTES
jgi:hypothetical protein